MVFYIYSDENIYNGLTGIKTATIEVCANDEEACEIGEENSYLLMSSYPEVQNKLNLMVLERMGMSEEEFRRNTDPWVDKRHDMYYDEVLENNVFYQTIRLKDAPADMDEYDWCDMLTAEGRKIKDINEFIEKYRY